MPVIDMGCPFCGRRVDGHAPTNGLEPPDEGSVSVCWGCSEVSVFELGVLGILRLRKPTEAESVIIGLSDDVQRARAAVRARAATKLDPLSTADYLRRTGRTS